MYIAKETDPWYHKRDVQKCDDISYISIQINRPCNLDCIFCYVDGSNSGDMNEGFFRNIITQACSLGLQRVQITGGEPTLSKNLIAFIDHLRSNGIEVLIPTNGMNINTKLAKQLYERQVGVGISLESIDPRIDDYLTNVAGAFERKMNGINNLIDAGYTKDEPALNIIIKTFKQNYKTFIDTWRWAKSKGIQPILDHAIPNERCKIDWMITGKELRELMDEIEKIEGKRFDLPWVEDEACNRLSTGVHIDVDGNVYPCSGLYVAAGNIKNQSLHEIWTNSKILDMCKTSNENLKGSCGSCEHKKQCYGCRAVAYAVFHDILAPDPSCWKFENDNQFQLIIPEFDYPRFEKELEIVENVRNQMIRKGIVKSLNLYRNKKSGRIILEQLSDVPKVHPELRIIQ